MQNSRPSFAVRYSWECSCGTWGTARTEEQAIAAAKLHQAGRKAQSEEGCGQYKLSKIVGE